MVSNPIKLFARQIYLQAIVHDNRINRLTHDVTELHKSVIYWQNECDKRTTSISDGILVWLQCSLNLSANILLIPITAPMILTFIYTFVLMLCQIEDLPFNQFKASVEQPICNQVVWLFDKGPCYGLEILHTMHEIYAWFMYGCIIYL